MCVFTILRFAPQKTPNSNIALKHILDFQPPIDFKEILSYLVFWICWVTFFGMVFGLSSRNVCSGISGGDLRTSPPSLQPFQGLLGQVKHQHEVARKDTWCFQLFLNVHPETLGKWSNVTSMCFKMGTDWNHKHPQTIVSTLTGHAGLWIIPLFPSRTWKIIPVSMWLVAPIISHLHYLEGVPQPDVHDDKHDHHGITNHRSKLSRQKSAGRMRKTLRVQRVTSWKMNMSNEKDPGCLGYFWGMKYYPIMLGL